MNLQAIVIDSNIFGDINKYNFDDLRIKTFMNSIGGLDFVDKFMTSVVYDELKKHIKDQINSIHQYINSNGKYIQKYIDESIYESAYNKMIDNLNSFIDDYNIIIIDCNEYVNLSEVNDWYFNQQKPFEKSKPKEFPDAFTISAINNYFKDSDYSVINVISNDNGFRDGVVSHCCGNYKVYDSISSASKDLLNYDDKIVGKIFAYIKNHSEIFDSIKDLILRGDEYNESDIMNIIDPTITDITIIGTKENYVYAQVDIDVVLEGYFHMLDPFMSTYSKAENEYLYIQYRSGNKIHLNNLSTFMKITFGDKDISDISLDGTSIISVDNIIDQLECDD
ncbi:MAG: PIN domain-containing protein [Bacilli bacterium]|nr:PIN domain-containing protein [Bacilli bacterium]